MKLVSLFLIQRAWQRTLGLDIHANFAVQARKCGDAISICSKVFWSPELACCHLSPSMMTTIALSVCNHIVTIWLIWEPCNWEISSTRTRVNKSNIELWGTYSSSPKASSILSPKLVFTLVVPALVSIVNKTAPPSASTLWMILFVHVVLPVPGGPCTAMTLLWARKNSCARSAENWTVIALESNSCAFCSTCPGSGLSNEPSCASSATSRCSIAWW